MNEKELAKEVGNALNALTFDGEAFVNEMLKEHRTLQQSFTRLCLEWFRCNAELDDSHFDLRNEATRDISKRVMAATKDFSCPSI